MTYEAWILVLVAATGGFGAPKPIVIDGFTSKKTCEAAASSFGWPSYRSAKCVRVK